jgi:hypothetical protein
VRAPLLALAALALAASVACIGSIDLAAEPSFDDGSAGGGALCVDDSDCVPAAATCCECPTFAVMRNDPVVRACASVECQKDQCAQNVTTRCSAEHRCELVCKAFACDQVGPPCAYGYAIDDNGCLSCECAVPAPNGCVADIDCTQTRADCCGCARGGDDTAVLVTERQSYDAMLMCPATPACPGIDVCTSDEPTCVQGRCALVSPDLPADACGRADLPPCGAGRVCLVNVSDQANMHGVGVCGAPP